MDKIKLIVEVDEKIVCKGFEQPLTDEERASLIRAIGNGTPYDDRGDCISRSALKEEMEKADATAIDYESLVDMYERLVDNAPAVKFSLLPADEIKDEAYMRGYEKGLAVGLLKTRPKGTWTFDEAGYFHCDQCNHKPHNQYATTSFCPSCGADMRGETSRTILRDELPEDSCGD